MLLCTLGASLLGNLLAGKGTIRAGEDTIRADQEFYSTPLRAGSKKLREWRFLCVHNFNFYCGLSFLILAHGKY